MRDHGKAACYRAENSVDAFEDTTWQNLLDLATIVMRDEFVQTAYPLLVARPLKLRPVMAHKTRYIGRYSPSAHRIELAWGGRSKLTLLHEMAHACLSGTKQSHGCEWREAYVYLVWRFLGDEAGQRLTAAFINNKVLSRRVKS